MSDSPNTAILHDAGWKAHESDGFSWRDPTTSEKQRLCMVALKALGVPSSVKLLDFGCGSGVFSDFFHSRGYNTTGVDISETVIKRNRERFPQVNFHCVRGDQGLPYPDGMYGAIFCSEVIEHVYDVQFIFSEFSRLLRPGGLLILTTPYHGKIKNVIIALFYFERHFDPTWQHIRFWTKKSLSQVCSAHGLKPVLWTYVGRFWPVPKSFFVVCKKAPV